MDISKSSEIWPLLNSPVPEMLWHYTTFAGLVGICSSERVFATEIRFLNDSEELVHARKILEEIAKEEQKLRSDNRNLIRDTLLKQVRSLFEDGTLAAKHLRVYVACFSEAEDQLSQWRGYADGSAGVSIGLDLSKLREHLSRSLAVFAPCVYDDEAKKQLLRSVVKRLFDATEEIAETAYAAAGEAFARGDASRDAFEDWFATSPDSAVLTKKLEHERIQTEYELLHLAALLKDKAFHEEREWRIVLPILKTFNDADCSYVFTPNLTSLVPRLQTSLGGERLPIAAVISGPGSHINAEDAIRDFMTSLNLNPQISRSNVPYRQVK